MEIYNFWKYSVREMLNTSLSVDKAQDSIESHIFDIKNNKNIRNSFNVSILNDRILVELKKQYFSIDEIKLVLTSIFSTGYSPCEFYLSTKNISKYKIIDEEKFFNDIQIKNITDVEIIAEPIWDISTEINSDMFHVTENTKVKKILEQGLVPKKSNSKLGNHPIRIYLFEFEKDCDLFVKKTKILKKYQNSIFTILKIDKNGFFTKNFNKEIEKMKFFKDPNSNGVYTYCNIKPNFISIYKPNIN